MKLIFRGKFKSYDDLPKNELPENAVMFKEPKSMAMVNVVACVIAVFLALILFAILDLRNRRNCMYLEAGWGLLVSALLMIPHELIHAVCMGGKDEVVYMFYSIKYFMIFVTYPGQMSKARFIITNFAPSFVLGWIPFAIGLIIPEGKIASILLSSGFLNVIGGCGDMMNVINAVIQMPRGSVTQAAGLNSYWFMPEDKAESDT